MTIDTLRTGWTNQLASFERVANHLRQGRLGTRSNGKIDTQESLSFMQHQITKLKKMLRQI